VAEKKKPQQEEEEFSLEDLEAASAAAEELTDEELLTAVEAAAEEAAPAPQAPTTPTARLRAAAKNPGVLRSIGSSLLQGFFKGGSDEGAGAITRMLVDPGNGAAWRGADGVPRFLESEGDVYRAGRDSEREVLRGAQEHYPKTAFVAEMIGDLGSDAVLSGLGLGGVGSAPYNVFTGGLSGLLGSDAELTPDKATGGDAASAVASTLLGAGLGYALPKVGEKVASVAPAALRRLREALDNTAVAQGTRVLLNGADQLARVKPPRPEAVVDAIDSGAIVPFGTTQGAFKRLEKQADHWGTVYASVIEELEKAGVRGPDAEALARELADKGDALRPTVGIGAPEVPAVYDDVAKRLEGEYVSLPRATDALVRVRQALEGVELPPGAVPDTRLGLREAEAVKRTLQDKAKYGNIEDTLLNDARQEVASIVREANENAVETAGREAADGSDLRQLSESFVPVKQKLGRVLEARGAAEKGTAAAAKRRGLSMSDYMAAGMGSGITDRLSLATLNNLARNRGTSAVASGSRGLARLAGAGARAAAANPSAVQAGGRELSAAFGRTMNPALARLLGLEDDNPDDEVQAALVEALRRRAAAP
jgi:hypothetical protein